MKPDTLPKLFLVYAALAATPALAHKPSDAFIIVDIEGTTVSGQVDIALKDLEPAIGIDANGDGQVTWGELRAQTAAVEAYVEDHVRLATDTAPCALVPLDLLVTRHTDGAYATVVFNTTCMNAAVGALDVTYDGLFDLDAQHRGLLRVTYREEQTSHVFTSGNRTFHFDATGGGPRRLVGNFMREGLRHIYRGYDHMLFLIALVLPAVFFRPGRRLLPRARLRTVLVETAKVVTAFTAAHTLSLCLTTFHILTPPPSRWVELLVALTILLTAVNNVWPLVKERRWLMGFAFGLVHGIGYASVLADLGLQGWHLVVPLVGFNLGVEAAQLIVIGAFLPLAFLLRRTRLYRFGFLYAGSAVTGMLALTWMWDQM